MTESQKQYLNEVGRKLKAALPDFYGKIQFNMNPQLEDVTVKVEQNFRFEKGKK